MRSSWSTKSWVVHVLNALTGLFSFVSRSQPSLCHPAKLPVGLSLPRCSILGFQSRQEWRVPGGTLEDLVGVLGLFRDLVGNGFISSVRFIMVLQLAKTHIWRLDNLDKNYFTYRWQQSKQTIHLLSTWKKCAEQDIVLQLDKCLGFLS